jgi:type II secretory pathway component PulF
MSRFQYEAVDGGGKRQSGELDADSRGQAFDRLSRQQLRPLRIHEVAEDTRRSQKTSSRSQRNVPKAVVARDKLVATGNGVRLRKREILQFTEELADLLDSGVRLEAGLGVLAGRKESKSVGELAARVRESLREGLSLSVALKRASPSFDELYLNMVQAGEQSGALGTILRRQQEQIAMVEELKSKIRGALVYPAFMIFAAGALMLVFMTFLVPQMRTLFSMGESSMPLITQLMIRFSEGVLHWWWLGLLLIGGIITSFRLWIQSPKGRLWWDEKKLRIPRAGRVMATGMYAQLAQTVSVLLTNGIPLTGTLRLVQAATPNRYVKAALEDVQESVADGVSLSRALHRTGGFPGEFVDAVVLGEQTGDLAASLQKAATRYDKELAKSISALTAVIQPIIIVFMAVMVGLIAFSMMSGIFQAVNSLR